MPNKVYDDEGKVNPNIGGSADDDLARLNRAEEQRQIEQLKKTDRSGDLRSPYGLKKNDPFQYVKAKETARQKTSQENAAGKHEGSIPKADLRDENFGYKNEKPGKGSKLLNRLTKGRRKWALIGGIFGTSGLLIGIILFILTISSLLIPNLAQNIIAYQSIRIARQYAKSQEDIIGDQMGAAAEPEAPEASEPTAGNDGFYKAFGDKVKSYGQKSSDLYNNIMNKYSISRGTQQAIENLVTVNQFKMTFKRTILGRERLLGVTLNDRTYLPVKPGVTRFVPGLKGLFQFKNDVTFSQDFAPALDNALRANGVGPIIRWFVAANIRKELGIGLIAWNVGKYQGKDATQAQEEEVREKVNDVDQNPQSDNAVSQDIKQADSDAQTAAQDTLASDQLLQEAIDNGGISSSVKAAVDNALANSGIKAVVSFISPWYAIFVYICTVFDGSLDRSGPTINNQTAQQQRAFYYVASAADQQKAGNDGHGDIAPAVQATANDLNFNNQLANSNALVRAAGVTPDTSNTPSAEASADGEYSLINVAIGSNFLASVINKVGTGVCPTLTNLYVAGAAAIIQLVVAFFTGGTSEAAGEAAGTAAKEVVQAEATNIITKFIVKIGESKILANRMVKFLGKTAADVAGLAAITIIAHEIVLARAGQIDSGFAQGTDLANNADAGGNIHFNELSRQGMNGRPLTQQELAQSTTEDAAYTSYVTGQQSTYQRYFALTNADSLASKVGLTVYSDIYGKHLPDTLYMLIGKLLNPIKLAATIFTPFSNKPALAAANNNDDSTYYGNVQFGNSPAEDQLETEDAYQPMQNQIILDASGQENAVSSTYGQCFTQQLGDLLSSGEIVRDSHGNVTPNQGLCSPDNLGENNPKFCYSVNVVDLTTITVQNPQGQNRTYSGCDLVWRWRLSQQYNNILENDTQIANPDRTAVSATN